MARTATIRTIRAVLAGISLLALTIALTTPAAAGVVAPLVAPPKWVELTPQQREILQPLAGEWDTLESFRRKKWLGIAQRYPAMTPDEQQRLQRRMQNWAKLTPAQRQQARERYKALQKAPPEHREVVKQKWQTYKELSDAEKEKLRQQAAHKASRKPGTPKRLPGPAPEPTSADPSGHAAGAPNATAAAPSAPSSPMPANTPELRGGAAQSPPATPIPASPPNPGSFPQQ